MEKQVMKYRVITQSENELDNITLLVEDGGVSCYDTETNEIEFFQSRIQDVREQRPDLDIFSALYEGKVSYEKLDNNVTTKEGVVKIMLDWLVVGNDDVEFVEDNTLFKDIFE